MMKANNKVQKLHVKTGDTVKVIAGNEKGKTGRIASVNTSTSKVIVEGINMVTKHNKPSAKSPNGGITQKEAYIHSSNVMLVENGQSTRTGKKINTEGKLQRYSKKSGELI
ncbi:50S ribosomal protein L24 [Adhaeribacter radiodurans]|jgi:large subunit ribosomal protein L24|uniref:Large ribosomal subunit protein uL24 n=1 Tax=Adhaeribacter radiodurans TaxID=2745197 RepID=A0A7L7LC36_9BACT|nr:50S ribosomal protein L24 [Adhaeribacter radiodurans]QMU30264.1 50S ribosomal protein L24 [Adhaeribacter radiodurans]